MGRVYRNSFNWDASCCILLADISIDNDLGLYFRAVNPDTALTDRKLDKPKHSIHSVDKKPGRLYESILNLWHVDKNRKLVSFRQDCQNRNLYMNT